MNLFVKKKRLSNLLPFNKEGCILEKNGILVAALVDMNEYEDYLDTYDYELKRQIGEGYKEYQRGELTEDLSTFIARLKTNPKKRTKR